eukprot:jgi/Ulvmu1/2314/UM013_0162.1
MEVQEPKWRFPGPFVHADTLMLARFNPEEVEQLLIPTPRLVTERRLDTFTAAVREKADWWVKVHKADIVQHWKEEAAEQDVDAPMFDFALQQLRHQAGQCEEGGIRPSPVPGVFESDQALDADLRYGLLAALKPLEDVPDDQKDWHPGSNQQVLDLVHPSLFPFVYGLSLCTTAQGGTAPDAAADASQGAPAAAAAVVDTSAPATGAAPAADSPDPDRGAARNPGDGAAGADRAAHSTAPAQTPRGGPAADREIAGGGGSAGAATPAEQRSDIVDAVAAASTWHTPSFNEWRTEMGSGRPVTDAPDEDEFQSNKFQWLPADILVGADGRVVFDSYVNNMHPVRHAALYAATARLLERMLPLFERTLAASTQRPQRVASEPQVDTWWDPQDTEILWERMVQDGTAREFVDAARAARAALYAQIGMPNPNAAATDEAAMDVEDDEFNFNEYDDELEERWRAVRVGNPPKLPHEFVPLAPPPPIDLKGERLQVVVKYAKIILTSKRPEYGGGVWHVEGMENEAIVASCIAYLAVDNITDSRLHFRSMVMDPNYEQNDDDGTDLMYGMSNESTMNEPLGSALCVPGRMLCWPNALQHRVEPFKLADPTRPGVRKFASVFLVNPCKRVLSTRDVPPQQMEWHDAESRLGSTMPEEVKRKVDALREFPISLERAKELRVELMEERRAMMDTTTGEAFERSFSLCEH